MYRLVNWILSGDMLLPWMSLKQNSLKVFSTVERDTWGLFSRSHCQYGKSSLFLKEGWWAGDSVFLTSISGAGVSEHRQSLWQGNMIECGGLYISASDRTNLPLGAEVWGESIWSIINMNIRKHFLCVTDQWAHPSSMVRKERMRAKEPLYHRFRLTATPRLKTSNHPKMHH